MFINSIPKPVTKLQPVTQNTAEINKNNDDDEYYYDDDDDYVLHLPPPNRSKFAPLSETMAPRPPSTTASYENTAHPKYLAELTNKSTPPTSTEEYTIIPSIIRFPTDIFHDLKPIIKQNRYINNVTIRPYTVRTRLGSTTVSYESTTDLVKTTTNSQQTSPPAPTKPAKQITTSQSSLYRTTTPPTTTTTQLPSTTDRTTTRKIYTIRPNRGQNKWKLSKSVKGGDKKNLLDYDERHQSNR